MNEEEFVEIVREEAPVESDEEAERVTRATLQTLGERITDGEAENLARYLPESVAEPLTDVPGEAEPFSLEEFTGRVSDRAGIVESEVNAYSRAVATALSMASEGELGTAREQLPSEFDAVVEPGGKVTEAEFLDAVAERAAASSEEEARDAVSAALRSLGERLTEGEAEDLALYLPDEFGAEIVEAGEEDATAYSYDEFVQRVSQRAGVEKSTAETYGRAVGSTLAETASEREVDAARKQLPDPFGVVFDPPRES